MIIFFSTGRRGSGGGSGSMPAASRSFTPSQTPDLGMGGEGLTEYGPVTEWRLSLDEEYCSMVREDFYYEQVKRKYMYQDIYLFVTFL